MEKKKVIPKKYDGDDCYRCEDMERGGKSIEDMVEEHDNCHGWNHCGPECCGECPYCGVCIGLDAEKP